MGFLRWPPSMEEEERLSSSYKGGRSWLSGFSALRVYFSVPYSYLDELSVAGECAAEYLALYQKLIASCHWKVYLAARGVLPYVGNLITKVSVLLLLLSLCLSGLACREEAFVEIS